MEYWSIPGKEDKPKVAFFTMCELAKYCGREDSTFRKYVQRGILPDANFRKPDTSYYQKNAVTKTVVPGARLYTAEVLAPKLRAIFKKIKRGRSITIEQKREIIKAFNDELRFFETY